MATRFLARRFSPGAAAPCKNLLQHPLHHHFAPRKGRATIFRRLVSNESGENKSGHIEAKPNESILFLDCENDLSVIVADLVKSSQIYFLSL